MFFLVIERDEQEMKYLTFTSTDNKVLSSSTKCAPNNIGALFLPLEATDNFCRIDIDEIDLTFGQIHEHIL